MFFFRWSASEAVSLFLIKHSQIDISEAVSYLRACMKMSFAIFHSKKKPLTLFNVGPCRLNAAFCSSKLSKCFFEVYTLDKNKQFLPSVRPPPLFFMLCFLCDALFSQTFWLCSHSQIFSYFVSLFLNNNRVMCSPGFFILKTKVCEAYIRSLNVYL